MHTEGWDDAVVGSEATCMMVRGISIIAAELDSRERNNMGVSLAIVRNTVGGSERNITIVCDGVVNLFVLSDQRSLRIVNSLEFNTMISGMLNFMEELVIFVLDLGSKSVAIMIDYIMVIVLSVLVVWLTIALSKRIITLVTMDRSTIERRVVLGRLFGLLSFFGSSDVHNRCGSFVGRNTFRCGMKSCTVDSSVVMAGFAMHKRAWGIVTEVVVTMVTEGGNHAMI